MRQLTYVGGSTIEWWDVPAPKLQDDRDALVRPLAVTRCDIDLTIVGGKSGRPAPLRWATRPPASLSTWAPPLKISSPATS